MPTCYFKMNAADLSGKIPAYTGTLLPPNKEHEQENLSIYASSIGAKLDYYSGAWRVVARTTDVAVTLMKLVISIPENCDIVYLSTSIADIYNTAIESGFTTDDYSIIPYDKINFVLAKNDLLTVLKLSRE